MAVKKKSLLQEELKGCDYMDILANGSKSNIFKSNSMIDYSYKTGITIMDYVYGYELNVFDGEDFIKKRKVLGIQAGSFNVITGRTQAFKTTITTKIAANIAFANGGNVYHYDTENRAVEQRIRHLTKLPNSWFDGEHPRYKVMCGAFTFDQLIEDIAELYENKMRNKELLLKDTGEVDSRNKPIKLMPPTLIIIDSLQNIVVKDYDIETTKDDLNKLRSNTQGARSAYTIRGFITDILPMLKEANIVVLCIAHKTTNMTLQAYGGVKKQFQYGSADERISGGSAVEFNASSVINMTGITSPDSRFHMQTDGFEGNTVLFEPTKSSTNASGNDKEGLGFEIIIDKGSEGVDNVRTLIRFMYNRGRLKGNKAGYTVIGDDGELVGNKFTWKNVHKEFREDKETERAFFKACFTELNKLIAKADEESQGSIQVFDIDNYLSEDNTNEIASCNKYMCGIEAVEYFFSEEIA